MFSSYRCCFTNKMTAGEIQSENKVPRIWVQNVLIYNMKTSQHTFWNTSLEDFHFPQTMCAAHGKMNFRCPWKPCKLELVESCAVSRPEERASVKYPPNKNTGPSENFPKRHKGCCPVADTAANFSSAQFGLFRSEKLSFLTSRISSCIRLSQNQILPRGCKAWCTCGPFFFFPRALQEVWGFLWNTFRSLGAAVRQERPLQPGGQGQRAKCRSSWWIFYSWW